MYGKIRVSAPYKMLKLPPMILRKLTCTDAKRGPAGLLSAIKSFIKTACFTLLLSASCLFVIAAPAQAGLPPGNAVTDGAALLRYALPIDNSEIRKVQGDLEGISEWLRSKRWGPIKKYIKKVKRQL